MTAPLLLSEECATAPRDWSSVDRAALTELLAAAATRPGAPPPGAVPVAGQNGWVWAAPGGRRLYLAPAADGSLQLHAIRAATPDAPAVPNLAPYQVARFARHGLAVLESAGPARPATDREVEQQDRRAHPVDELSALAFMEDEVLLGMGVPYAMLQAVRQADDAEMLEALGLEAVVVERLRAALAPPAPEDVAFVPEVLKYRVPDLDTLRRYYLGDVRRLLLNVTPEQQALVDLDVDVPIQVNGVAGSGKTTVALYRMRRQLEQGDAFRPPRLLYVSFNKTLVLTAQELLRELVGDAVRGVEIRTLHAWCWHYLRSRRRVLQVADEDRRTALITDTIARFRREGVTSALLDREISFWFEEISQIVKGRCRGDREEYLRVERAGRGTNLTTAGRVLVWNVYESYESGLRSLGQCDWDDMILQALDLLEQDTAFEPYHEVLVDEAQDLSRAALMLCARLVHRERPRLTVLADATQRIYQHGFRWKDVGLSTRSRVAKLPRNFRGTSEILAVAGCVIASADLDGDPDILAAEDSRRRGPKPRFLVCRSTDHEEAAVAAEIARLAREGAVNLGNVAVLTRSRKRLSRVRRALDSVGVPNRHYRDEALVLGDACVKLITLHSAKGLEFPVVYLVGANDGELPEAADDLPPEEREVRIGAERRLLYVGLTRAAQELCVTHVEGRRSLLFPPYVEALVSVERPN